jgi:hypothetical protein
VHDPRSGPGIAFEFARDLGVARHRDDSGRRHSANRCDDFLGGQKDPKAPRDVLKSHRASDARDRILQAGRGASARPERLLPPHVGVGELSRRRSRSCGRCPSTRADHTDAGRCRHAVRRVAAPSRAGSRRVSASAALGAESPQETPNRPADGAIKSPPESRHHGRRPANHGDARSRRVQAMQMRHRSRPST